MKQRINFFAKGQNAMKAMYGLGAYLSNCTIEQELLHLVYFRVSQINGCAYCLDMHSKDLLATGENPQRLFLLDAWREAPLYTARECAALEWAEAVTKIANGDVADDVYAKASSEFSEAELVDLTLAVTTINTYNRFNISFRTEAGGYKVGQHKVQAT
ncbi:carboxymuconolactone decarboxylase family protein [Sphingobacterium thalpophilum]|uniref:Argininosuccinate synthase n=1 Tax=Sphingobacterium thalpophilum TaxID=259 RepID=A0A4U9UB29_9SPHI|nr:carboxymuconolactone decarboxylase family protein [Sphingobacterium thalpophilum]VTR29773.1 Argininosuccinate synthase [Sphingobacterium thalpophilum]